MIVAVQIMQKKEGDFQHKLPTLSTVVKIKIGF
jgi:hypothetical protein